MFPNMPDHAHTPDVNRQFKKYIFLSKLFLFFSQCIQSVTIFEDISPIQNNLAYLSARLGNLNQRGTQAID